MTSKLITALLLGAGLALAACESPGGKVSVLQSEHVALVPGSTYAWAPVADAANGDPRIDNDIIRQRIRTAVDSSMAAKGYRRVDDPASAQYLVSYHVGLQDRTDYRVDNTFGRPGVACGMRACVAGYGWGMYGAPTDVRSVNYVDGTLMLDVTDRSSDQLAWRATSERRVDQGDGSQERLTAMVADMTKTMPGVAAAPAAN